MGVLRGGSWNNNPDNARSANRNRNNADNRNNNVGFRLLCSGTAFLISSADGPRRPGFAGWGGVGKMVRVRPVRAGYRLPGAYKTRAFRGLQPRNVLFIVITRLSIHYHCSIVRYLYRCRQRFANLACFCTDVFSTAD